MATKLGVTTIKDILAIECDVNPSLTVGLAAPVGSFASAIDGSGLFYKSGAGDTAWIKYQNELVSGTNVKTINNHTILGSGDQVTGVTSVFFVHASSWSPNDSTNYYLGSNGINITTTATNVQLGLGQAATLIGGFISICNNTVAGTSENVTLNLRNITQGTSSLIGTLTTNGGSTTTAVNFTYSGLSIAIASTDLIALELVTPVWVTNPTAIFVRATMLFKI